MILFRASPNSTSVQYLVDEMNKADLVSYFKFLRNTENIKS